MKPYDLPHPSFTEDLQNPKTASAVLRWTRQGTKELMTAPCKPSNQFQRANYLADEVVKLSLLLDELSSKLDKAKS